MTQVRNGGNLTSAWLEEERSRTRKLSTRGEKDNTTNKERVEAWKWEQQRKQRGLRESDRVKSGIEKGWWDEWGQASEGPPLSGQSVCLWVIFVCYRHGDRKRVIWERSSWENVLFLFSVRVQGFLEQTMCLHKTRCSHSTGQIQPGYKFRGLSWRVKLN